MASTPALLTVAAAMACEIGACCVPWLDNLLDTLAMPAAVTAGTVVAAANAARHGTSRGYRTSRKNARRSSTYSAGSSLAAKWPPLGIIVKRTRL